MYKRLYQFGVICYIIFIVLSIVFYKERAFFADFAFYIFLIVRDNDFITTNRFIAFITEWPAVLARKAGLPLNILGIIYSATLILYYFLCYSICGRVLKQYRFALLILFLNILFVSDTFYMAQSELLQGMVLMIVVFAALASNKLNKYNIVLAYLALLTAGFAHLLLLFPCMFLFIFFFIEKGEHITRKRIYIFAVFYLLVFSLKKYVFISDYDKGALDCMDNISRLFPNYFTAYSFRHFFSRCLDNYYWIPLLSAGVIAFYSVSKQWAKLALFIVFGFGYLMLINICFPTAGTTEAYIEIQYMPLAIMIGLPFIFDVLPRLEVKRLAIPVVALIMITGLLRIYLSHIPYTARQDWERSFIEKNRDRKLVINSKYTPRKLLQFPWVTPCEFWLLSTVESGKTASIVISDNPDELAPFIGETHSLIVPWGCIQYKDLPPKYFHFTDTVSSYEVIN